MAEKRLETDAASFIVFCWIHTRKRFGPADQSKHLTGSQCCNRIWYKRRLKTRCNAAWHCIRSATKSGMMSNAQGSAFYEYLSQLNLQCVYSSWPISAGHCHVCIAMIILHALSKNFAYLIVCYMGTIVCQCFNPFQACRRYTRLSTVNKGGNRVGKLPCLVWRSE